MIRSQKWMVEISDLKDWLQNWEKTIGEDPNPVFIKDIIYIRWLTPLIIYLVHYGSFKTRIVIFFLEMLLERILLEERPFQFSIK